jgi:hypothetical protein
LVEGLGLSLAVDGWKDTPSVEQEQVASP